MNDIVQLTCCKQEAIQGGSWISPAVLLSRLDHIQRKSPPSYSVQQRLHKMECHSALDRLDFERFASQPMPQNS